MINETVRLGPAIDKEPALARELRNTHRAVMTAYVVIDGIARQADRTTRGLLLAPQDRLLMALLDLKVLHRRFSGKGIHKIAA